MFTSFLGRTTRTCVLTLLCLGVRGSGLAQVRADDSAFRVFLRDGTAVVSYGDFARVGDRLIFSMPLDGAADELQLVDLPISSVDLPKTEQYAEAVRAARYATTFGEADYAALTATVARALNQVAATNDLFERLQIAERARGIVATWNRDHYGYRASDVQQLQGLLDELVSELRADAGVNQFDLNLVATVEAPKAVILPRPTPAEAIEQVLRVARATDIAADRAALLRAAARALDRPGAPGEAAWVKRTRASIDDAIAAELRADRGYRDLARTALARALAAASNADGPGVEAVLDDIRRRDERLGHKRPAEVAGLVNAVERHLESARRLRLARDRWQLQLPALRAYEDLARPAMQQLARARKPLDAIRRLSGPDPDVLPRLADRLGRLSQLVTRISPPADVAAVHATLTSACQMALSSVTIRRTAIERADLQLAWDASSAAAGAMMLLAQARDGLQAALRPPELK